MSNFSTVNAAKPTDIYKIYFLNNELTDQFKGNITDFIGKTEHVC